MNSHVWMTGYTDPFVSSSGCTSGLLIQPFTIGYANEINARKYPIVAIDNGCFTEWGRKAYSKERYAYLQSECARRGMRVRWTTVRDVPMSWKETRKAYDLFRDDVPSNRAICVQDGCVPSEVPWDDISCLFVGGSTEWKVSSYAKSLCFEARERGKTTHMGRVNSINRARIAASFMCDTSDGTYLLHEHMKGNLYEAVKTVRAWSIRTNGE